MLTGTLGISAPIRSAPPTGRAGIRACPPAMSFPDVPWGRQGVERAAQLIARGLAEEPGGSGGMGDWTCDELVTGFWLLTGTEPLQPCPAEGAP